MIMFTGELTGKELFRKYWELGDATSSLKLSRATPISPITGKHYTRDAVYKSMWRWAIKLDNFDEAYELVRQSLANQGIIYTQEQFKLKLKEKSKSLLTKAQYKRFHQHWGFEL